MATARSFRAASHSLPISFVRLARVLDSVADFAAVLVTIPPTRTAQWLALVTETRGLRGRAIARAEDVIEFRYEEGVSPRIVAERRRPAG